MHLILPVNAGAAKDELGAFCKTLFSALVHGYEPTIVNWDADGRGDWLFMQRLKVNGLQYPFSVFLERLPDDEYFRKGLLNTWKALRTASQMVI